MEIRKKGRRDDLGGKGGMEGGGRKRGTEEFGEGGTPDSVRMMDWRPC
jgi:hypothetical protein